MQVLLIFNKEDPSIVTLKNAILKCGYIVNCCRNIQETHEAFKKVNYDLVFIDCRRNQSSNIVTNKSNTSLPNSNTSQYDYENICREEREIPSVLPLLKMGFNKTFSETTNLNRCINELLNLEYGEVSTVKRLLAAHSLFTALEYTNDPIEIMNDKFQLLYVNNAFEKLTGLTLNEVSGQDFNSLHKIDLKEQLLSKQISPGTAWEYILPFPKVDAEVSKYSSITIPIIVQGETNKIQNYVTITTTSDKNVKNTFKTKKQASKLKDDAINTAPQDNNTNYNNNTNLTHSKKLNSFYLPKKSLDFDRFAHLSLSTDEPLKDHSSSFRFMHSSTNTQAADLTDDDQNQGNEHEKLSSSHETTSECGRSTPDFHGSNPIGINFQRKRSYDVHSPTMSDMFPRRHSMAKVHQQSIEAPIRKVINIICLAHENATVDIVKQNLDKALDILRSTELYNPSLLDNDKHTNDLVSGLMSNGLQKKIPKANIFGTKPLLNSVSTLTQNYVKNLSPEINELLNTEIQWSFDIIALERLTNKRPLITLGLKIMNRFDVCEYLKIDETILVNWLTLIESNYKPSNPYHNSTHASDVLHATAYFLSTDKLTEILDDGDRCASLIAAAVHDLNHPGRTNAFLCNSDNDLAIMYNDQAVLENHHASLAFQLTRQNQDANIFKNLTRDEYRALRSIIIDMVLATEMNKHFEHLNKFVNKFSVSDDEKPTIKSTEMLQLPENKILIKRILIKCADVSNPCKPLDIYKEWAKRIASEYFEQTDEEKQKGLPVVMPTFDRLSCNIPKAQISFIEYFITDMFEAWCEFIDTQEVLSNLQANTAYWREVLQNTESIQSDKAQKDINSETQKQEKTTNRNNSIIEDSEDDLESIEN